MATAARLLAPDSRSAVLAELPAAIAGDDGAARRFARAWHALVVELLADRPEAPSTAADVLDHVALTAPFLPGGPLRALVSAAAGIIPSMTGSAPAIAPLELPDTLEYRRFARAVLRELSGTGSGLERVMATWQLSITDVARLFGVARQAVQQWLDDGVPPARQVKLLAILRMAELLERNLQPERISAIVRTTARTYGARSILEAIADNDQAAVLESIERSFDWSSSA
jgi:hypothetical protein